MFRNLLTLRKLPSIHPSFRLYSAGPPKRNPLSPAKNKKPLSPEETKSDTNKPKKQTTKPKTSALFTICANCPLVTDPNIATLVENAAPTQNVPDSSKQKPVSADALDEHEKIIFKSIIKPSNIPIGFKDIHLKPSTKQTIDAYITYPILYPELFTRGILSRENATGILLFGPPGTGKTMLAKAVAKESGSSFMNVRLGDVLHKYYGEAEKRIEAIFSLAQKHAPMVIFLDEVDSLLRMRGGSSGDKQGERVVNVFMSAWDGLESQKKGVIVMGATNRPFDLDDAALRRFPKRILVDLPTERAREEIIRLQLRDDIVDSEVDLKELAQRTANWSGSDLKNLCLTTAMYAVREIIGEGYSERRNKILSSQFKKRNRAAARTIDRISNPNEISENDSEIPVLHLKRHHFALAFSETSSSISDEMGSVTALRKWDAQYGGSTLGRKRTTKFGFEPSVDASMG